MMMVMLLTMKKMMITLTIVLVVLVVVMITIMMMTTSTTTMMMTMVDNEFDDLALPLLKTPAACFNTAVENDALSLLMELILLILKMTHFPPVTNR